MAVIRLTLLIAIMGGLTLLLVQNWSPVLSLVFLGMRSQPLPLALWILFSLVAGAGTSLFISNLSLLASFLASPPVPRPTTTTASRTKANSQKETSTRYNPQTPKTTAEAASQQRFDEDFDDWENNSADDDWDFDQQPTPPPASSSRTESVREAKSYERPQQPQSGSRSGSTYSYSYREPKNTAVGKTESVYDADYRVIIPPYQPPVNNTKNEEDDDWSFFEDDEEDNQPRK